MNLTSPARTSRARSVTVAEAQPEEGCRESGHVKWCLWSTAVCLVLVLAPASQQFVQSHVCVQVSGGLFDVLAGLPPMQTR